MFKILLINSCNKKTVGHAANDMCFPPLNLIHLATYIQQNLKNQVEIKIIDAEIETIESVKEQILSFDPNLVGISVLTPTYEEGLNIAKFIKDKTNAKIVLGNDHASFFAEKILEKRDYIDFIIKNDVGEFGFLDLIKNLIKKSNSFVNVPDLVFRCNGRIISNESIRHPLPEVIPNLDYIKDFYETYRDNYNLQFGKFHKSKMHPLIINTIRGCSFFNNKCTYCGIYDLTMRQTSPNFFWKTVRKLNEVYKTNFFFEICDSFSSFPIFIEKLLKAGERINTKKKGIEFEFYIKSRELLSNKNLISYLKMLNTTRVNIGLDSGSNTVLLNKINKRTTVEQNTKAIEILTKNNIKIHASFVLGAYKETNRETYKTIDYIDHLLEKFPNTFSAIELSGLIPLPGSWMWRKMMIENNKFKKKYGNEDLFDIQKLKKEWADNFTQIDFDRFKKLINKKQREYKTRGIAIGSNIG